MNNDNENIKWSYKIKPLLESYLKSLFIGFEEENIIIQSSPNPNDPIKYRVNDKSITTTTTTTIAPTIIPSSTQNAMFLTLFDLRNIARAVYENLEYSDSSESHKFPLSRILEKLEENKAFSIRWKDKSEIQEIFDKLETLSNDPNIEKDVEKKLTENNINPNIIIAALLEFYGRQKAIQHFGDANSQSSTFQSEESDWVLLNNTYAGGLYFNFKLRRTDPVPDQQSLLQTIRQLETSSIASYALLVVFTYENSGSFDKLKFQFRQILLNDLRDYSSYTDKIKFIPISTLGINAIDDEFNEFSRTNIQDHFSFVFKNQPPPRGFLARNDHFLERTFDIKKTSFKILIDPTVKTKFWRFGFRFIQNETFPSLSQDDRHQNKDVADIHISVGDQKHVTEGSTWINENKLTIQDYNVKPITNTFNEVSNYFGNTIQLTLDSNENASKVDITMFTEDRLIGRRIYNLSNFKYCRLFAWCDNSEFELNTKIEVKHKNF